MARPRKQPQTTTVAVDLTPLLPGGLNGGLRIAIFALLQQIRILHPRRFKFLFLSSTAAHHEIKEYEQDGDKTLCIIDRGNPAGRATPIVAGNRSKNRFYRDFGVDLFYCPFGDIRHAPSEYGVIAWVADVLHRDYPQTLGISEMNWREGYYCLLRNGADAIQVNSKFTSESLVRHYGIEPADTFVTYLAPRQLMANRTLGVVKPYFLYPANFWVHKNHETLLVAYAHYLSEANDSAWELRLTGSPDARMIYLQTICDSLGLRSRVHFEGFLDNEQFSQLATGAAALVFPSLYEGFGMPIAEAMQLGLPVIASRSGSIPEVGGDVCHYVDAAKPLEIAEGMIAISSNPAYRNRLSSAGREQAKRFSLEDSARLLAAKLIEVAERRRDLRSRVGRLKNASYGRLRTAKLFAAERVQHLKAILSGA
jgi:glycosyltransferase involved in cell wall biosynthesis